MLMTTDAPAAASRGDLATLAPRSASAFALLRGPIPDTEWVACVEQAARHA